MALPGANSNVVPPPDSTPAATTDIAKPLVEVLKPIDPLFPPAGLFGENPREYQSFEESKAMENFTREPFSREITDVLLAPINESDIEIKPDGMLYLPEIKYRRILNRAFGPGGWGLVPKSMHTVVNTTLTREYALYCHGRFVAQARGEQDYFSDAGIPTATEGAKSNALVRCCKDLGIASELWDPNFIREFKERMCVSKFAKNVATAYKKILWRRVDRKFEYPYVEEPEGTPGGQQQGGPPYGNPGYANPGYRR
ncbi:hypothetical protein HK097_000157 [Rhizophlyctis rosea]|uniref:Mitochondrial genome maintenance protein MGM101 n=1 Tax=Rhizophlyctis rosea TaxID=64517 RepID=A0AAD5S5T4_9FUNG|nr:hypothetical protein HK097_000157 [Rhizophlyctis rosea]